MSSSTSVSVLGFFGIERSKMQRASASSRFACTQKQDGPPRSLSQEERIVGVVVVRLVGAEVKAKVSHTRRCGANGSSKSFFFLVAGTLVYPLDTNPCRGFCSFPALQVTHASNTRRRDICQEIGNLRGPMWCTRPPAVSSFRAGVCVCVTVGKPG